MYIYIHRVTIIYKGIMFKNMLISSTWFYKQHETGAGNEYYFLFLCSPAQQHQRIHQFGKL